MEEKKLYILTYDHGGYVLWKDEVKPRLKDLEVWLEKYPKLKIGLDYESFTFDEFSRCDPEIVEKIAELLEKYPGRVGLGATTYGQPLSLTISEESNARQLSYAVRTNLHYFGQTPNVYAISEFALNNQTPQLISQCGYKAAILRSHVMGYGYPRTFNSSWGRWIGKDGTEIPAVPTYDKQGRGFNCTTVDNWILSRWPRSDLYSLEDFEKMFSEYSPLLASRYDDLTQEIEPVTAHIEEKENYQHILLEDIPEIYGEAKDELRTTDNDFHVQMPWGYCGNEIFNGVRASEVAAVQAEKLNSLAIMLGGVSMQSKLDDAWKYALAAQHHDVTICGLLDLSRRFIPSSLDASTEVKEMSLKTLELRFADEKGESLLVFNPNSFEADEWIEVETEKDCSVFDENEALECYTVESDGKKFLRVHVVVPALTAKKYILSDCKTKSENSVFTWNQEKGELTTPCYCLKLNENGIVSIDDIIRNCRLIDNGEGELFTALVDDKPCKSNGNWTVNVSAFGAQAVQKGNVGSISYTIEMQFNGNDPKISCKTQFELHGERVGKTGVSEGLVRTITVDGHRHADKLNLILNTCLEKDRRMVRDLPYSISDWDGQVRKTEDYWYGDDYILIDTEVSPEESFNSTTYIQGIYWLSLRDKEKGIAVMNRGCMGAAVYGNRVELPLLYSNEYLCGTRILDGIYEDEFAILPFDSTLSDADVHRSAVLYNYPVIGKVIEKGNGDLSQFSVAEFNADGGEVVMTAMYPENGNILARFCNYSDDFSTLIFKPTVGMVECEVDLLGNELKAVADSKLSFRPWEIKTVRINCKSVI